MNNSTTIINLIKQRRQELNMSQRELARLTGVNNSTISRYEKHEREFPINDITKFAEALGLETEYLLGVNKSDILEEHHPIPSNLIPLEKARKIPVVGSIAAGKPKYAYEDIDEHILIDNKFDADFALKVDGDSMIDAGISPGDYALIKKGTYIENGEIAAVLIDDSATLKKIYKYEDFITLQPCNAKYPPITVKEIDRPYIIGKLTGIMRKY